MQNVIKYYYNLTASEIHQKNKIYRFTANNNKYILCPYERNIEELEEIYKLYIYLTRLNMYCHKIILNKNNSIVTNINKTMYVLLLENIENKKIDIRDINYFSRITINEPFIKIKRSNWYDLWIKKIDYIEYQISQFGIKYKLIRESCDYYIGIVENCISMLFNLRQEKNTTISHNRIYETTTLEEYLNPLNFIIDNRVRDISEYIKSCMTKNINVIPILNKYITENKLRIEEIQLLFIRIMYPSNYLDTCEQILDKKLKEENLKEIIDNTENYEKQLKEIYNYLSRITYIPEIEWLKKNAAN